ncbi:MAG: phosphoethanolamine--lipid A transferase [Rubrivivax sp.]|nr:phosphoethanolamine--lipid A transferase [Rubrivivax sp.]
MPFLRLPWSRSATTEAGRFTIAATVDQLLLAAGLFWALAANHLLLGRSLADRAPAEPQTWGFALALIALLASLHYLLLAPLANRWTVKPLLAVLTVVTAFAVHFMQAYGVYLDPSMMRNVLRTDVAEARELLSWSLLPHLLAYAAAPLLLLSRVRIVQRPWLRASAGRLASALVVGAVFVATLMAVFQPLASLMRNHRELRYLATPANVLWSVAAVGAAQAHGAARPRQAIGLDATMGAARARPLLVVMVVGETARRANWGLSGYARQTTPELAQLPVINFADVTSCGTNTETSVPCMFAPVGRRDYDESRIRGSESLLHVAAHAGVAVHWRDNQSGCKGVCEGLPQDEVASLHPDGLCADGHCLDEGLLAGLDERLAAAASDPKPGTQLLVLHTLGNHGPSYFRRYPDAFKRFQPACENDDLRLCSQQEIVNAYDNALLYTDHVLASLVTRLQAAADRVDTAMVYVSDHGESLGENQLYLHGLPYAIAPDVQTQVPMVMWLSAGLPRAAGLDVACLQRRAAAPAAHDHLFHTVLGLLGVHTALYEPAWDLTSACRTAAP